MGELWRAKAAIPGLRMAPQWFQTWFAGRMSRRGFRRLRSDPQVFYREEDGVMMVIHVDDILPTCSEDYLEQVVGEIKQEVALKPGITVSPEWQKYLGREWRRR